jgi:hypothetical protein
MSGRARREQGEFARELDRQLRQKAPGDPQRRTWKQRLAATLIHEAVVKKNMMAAKLLLDRWCGPISNAEDLLEPQRIQVIIHRNVERFPQMNAKLLPKPDPS